MLICLRFTVMLSVTKPLSHDTCPVTALVLVKRAIWKKVKGLNVIPYCVSAALNILSDAA